ncbi:MAG TPA: SRPBCC domain-containing protein [Terracidiphilus sp.]
MKGKNNVSTRRQAIAGAVLIAAGAAMRPAQAWAEAEEISHTSEAIHQEASCKASRKRVFDALTDTRQFDKITQIAMGTTSLGNQPTAISGELGGVFTLFGGHIIGRQIELVQDERIVQCWRVVDWPAGIHSIAKFELVEEGSGTKIVFDHTGFPQGLGRHLADGWKSHYWVPLEKYLAGEAS